jgi:ferredoxin-NADP reductase
MLRLRVIDYYKGESQQIEIDPETLDQEEYWIGSEASCDLMLTGLNTDQVHACICPGKDHYYFKYFGNLEHDVYLNNTPARCHNHVLQTGDMIRMGQYILMVEAWELPTKRSTPDLIHSGNALENQDVQLLTQQAIQPSDPWPPGETLLHCVRVIQETPKAKTFSFVSKSFREFSYQPGQQLYLRVEIDGAIAPYPYFIVSSPTRPYTLDITIQLVEDNPTPNDQVSNWLYEHLHIGSRLTAYDSPSGSLVYAPDPPDKVLFISEGIGVLPFVSMTRWTYDTATSVDIVFVHAAPTINEILFQQELLEFSYRMPDFRLVMTLTESYPGQSWMGYRGPITASLLQAVVNDLPTRDVYVCGTRTFLEAIRQILMVSGLPLNQYHEAEIQDHLLQPSIPAMSYGE